MTDESETPAQQPALAGEHPAGIAGALNLPPGLAATVEQRPEVAVGAAFAGGFVLAMILKRLGR